MMPADEGLWDPPATGHPSQKWFQVTPEAGRGDKERVEECELEQSSTEAEAQRQEKAEQVKNFLRDPGKKKGDELYTWVAALDALQAL